MEQEKILKYVKLIVPKHCAESQVIAFICLASKVKSTTTRATNAVAFKTTVKCLQLEVI